MSQFLKHLSFLVLSAFIVLLYLYNLDGVGMLDTDEPRYAAIGRAMALSGDWVTPKLWGNPWFEKPALLYWLVAVGTSLGFNMDLAPRLPVALLSLAFLGAYFMLLWREFGFGPAGFSTFLLATSAGWLANSNLALTDLPLAAFFGLAIVLALPLVKAETDKRFIRQRMALIGVSLGLATLSKGLVPLVLALPLVWFLRRYWKQWWIGAVAFLLIALPWYGLVIARNGNAFVNEFFWKHHLSRFYSTALQHVQPWWFYVPVLLAAVFPWTPVIAVLFRKDLFTEPRRRMLLGVFLFGVLFFSAPLNKLPGYLLPLLPVLWCVIASIQSEKKCPWDLSRGVLIGCAVLIGFIPIIGMFLPTLLNRSEQMVSIGITSIPFTIMVISLISAFIVRKERALAALIVLCAIAGCLLKRQVYPQLDEQVSVRGTWRRIEQRATSTCGENLHRAWDYGFAYYRGAPFPPCTGGTYDWRLQQKGKTPPVVVPNPSQ